MSSPTAPPAAPGLPAGGAPGLPAGTAGVAAGDSAVGVAFGVAAYGAWGVLPLYFHALHGVPAADIVGHRVVWSVVFLLALLLVRGGGLPLTGLRPHAGRFVLGSLFLSTNWLLYVWSVSQGHVLDASLGYYINPLVNVLLGRLVLGERLSRAQAVAVGFAAAGVAVQGLALGRLPWVSLTIAASFGFYGLIRKGLVVEGPVALLVETLVVAPLALGWLLFGAGPEGRLEGPLGTDLLLLGTGAVTALPLLWFGAAARRLRLSTLGVLQYLSPTGQFLCGVFLFGEPWGAAQAACFGLIWLGVLVYAVDAARGLRR